MRARVGQASCTTCGGGNWLDSACNRDGEILSPEGPRRTCSHGGEQRGFGGVGVGFSWLRNQPGMSFGKPLVSVPSTTAPTQKRIHGACSWHRFYLAPQAIARFLTWSGPPRSGEFLRQSVKNAAAQWTMSAAVVWTVGRSREARWKPCETAVSTRGQGTC